MACRRTRKLWGHRSVLASTVTLTLLLLATPGIAQAASADAAGVATVAVPAVPAVPAAATTAASAARSITSSATARVAAAVAAAQPAAKAVASAEAMAQKVTSTPPASSQPLGGSSSGAPTSPPPPPPAGHAGSTSQPDSVIGVARRHDRPPRRDRGLGRHPPQRAARLAGPIAGQGDRGRSRSARPPGHARRRGRPDPRRRTPCARRLTALRPALELRSCVGVPAAGRHATRRPGGVRRAADRGAGGDPVSFVVGHRSPAGGGGPTRRGHGRAAGRRRSCRRYPRASARRASGGTCRHRGARRLGGSSDRRRGAGWV